MAVMKTAVGTAAHALEGQPESASFKRTAIRGQYLTVKKFFFAEAMETKPKTDASP